MDPVISIITKSINKIIEFKIMSGSISNEHPAVVLI